MHNFNTVHNVIEQNKREGPINCATDPTTSTKNKTFFQRSVFKASCALSCSRVVCSATQAGLFAIEAASYVSFSNPPPSNASDAEQDQEHQVELHSFRCRCKKLVVKCYPSSESSTPSWVVLSQSWNCSATTSSPTFPGRFGRPPS